jgi:hypothetical protein
MDNSKQNTTKTARPAATIIWTTSPLALSSAIRVPENEISRQSWK